MRVVLDIEADGLNPTQIWCVVTKDLDNDDVQVFTGERLQKEFPVWISQATLIVGHNALEYDAYQLNRLIPSCIIPYEVVHDTLVVGRLLDSGRDDGHSLESYGELLGFPKQEFSDWSKLSDEMIEYCKNDVELNFKLYEYQQRITSRNRGAFTKAIECEHRIQLLCLEMSRNGFKFDLDGLERLDKELEHSIAALDTKIQASFPPKVELIQLKTKVKEKITPFNPGSPKQIVERLWEAGWKPTERTKTHNEFLKQRGKKDPDKLKRHERYGWKVNEVNLSTLPDTAPEGCKYLVEHILLSARRRTINEWRQAAKCHLTQNNIKDIITRIEKQLEPKIESGIENRSDTNEIDNTDDTMVLALKKLKLSLQSKMDAAESVVNEEKRCVSITVTIPELLEVFSVQDVISITNGTCRIHGRYNPLGTVTQRCSHSNPNLGNIATKKTIKYNSPRLRELATDLGGRMRSFWVAPEDGWLVGTDMESAHLRIFAHLIDDKEFTQSLISGDKKLGTDPHSVNKRRLGDLCVDRDRAKTFIFSFLNGAGASKVAEIFSCSLPEAAQVLDEFVKAYPGLERLKSEVIPRDAARGYFVGVDGRLVKADSEHKMIGMYLQNMESVLMKYAWIKWNEDLKKNDIPFRAVNWVHDEWVTEITADKACAEMVGRMQSDSIRDIGETFGLRCPMGGEYKIGKTWLEVH